MAMTWDMYTSGELRGQLIRPLRYTDTEDDATRVRVWLRLATRLGSWRLNTLEGLDHFRMLDPTATDAERSALVRDLVLDDPGVAEVIGEPVVTTVDGELLVSANFRAVSGALISVGG